MERTTYRDRENIRILAKQIKIKKRNGVSVVWLLNRGGNYGNGANAGEANGNLNNPRSNANDNLGFFCAFLITSEHAGARYRRAVRREDKGRFPLP